MFHEINHPAIGLPPTGWIHLPSSSLTQFNPRENHRMFRVFPFFFVAFNFFRSLNIHLTIASYHENLCYHMLSVIKSRSFSSNWGDQKFKPIMPRRSSWIVIFCCEQRRLNRIRSVKRPMLSAWSSRYGRASDTRRHPMSWESINVTWLVWSSRINHWLNIIHEEFMEYHPTFGQKMESTWVHFKKIKSYPIQSSHQYTTLQSSVSDSQIQLTDFCDSCGWLIGNFANFDSPHGLWWSSGKLT